MVGEHEQLTLDVDQVDDQAVDVDFGAWVRSLPAAPWWQDEERAE